MMSTRECHEMIKQAHKDLSVIAKNDKAYSEDYIEGFAWGAAYVISAKFPHYSADSVYEEIVKKEDDYDHYRGYCPNCETLFKDIAIDWWNKNGTEHHSVYYCPNCGMGFPVVPPPHPETEM